MSGLSGRSCCLFVISRRWITITTNMWMGMMMVMMIQRVDITIISETRKKKKSCRSLTCQISMEMINQIEENSIIHMSFVLFDDQSLKSNSHSQVNSHQDRRRKKNRKERLIQFLLTIASFPPSIYTHTHIQSSSSSH